MNWPKDKLIAPSKKLNPKPGWSNRTPKTESNKSKGSKKRCWFSWPISDRERSRGHPNNRKGVEWLGGEKEWPVQETVGRPGTWERRGIGRGGERMEHGCPALTLPYISYHPLGRGLILSPLTMA